MQGWFLCSAILTLMAMALGWHRDRHKRVKIAFVIIRLFLGVFGLMIGLILVSHLGFEIPIEELGFLFVGLFVIVATIIRIRALKSVT